MSPPNAPHSLVRRFLDWLTARTPWVGEKLLDLIVFVAVAYLIIAFASLIIAGISSAVMATLSYQLTRRYAFDSTRWSSPVILIVGLMMLMVGGYLFGYGPLHSRVFALMIGAAMFCGVGFARFIHDGEHRQVLTG